MALQVLQAPRLLHSRDGHGTLGGDLGTLYSRLDSNQQDVPSVTPLLRKVVNNATDADIWNAVYDLVTQSTPPPKPETMKSKSIGEGLAAFRNAFQSSSAELGVPPSTDGVQQIIDEGEANNLSGTH